MNIRRARGLSLIGFILVLGLVIFFAYIGMRIVPIYMEYWSVVSALNGLQNEPGSGSMSPFDVKVKVLNRLYVSYSGTIKEEHIRVTRRDGLTVRVKYEVRRPLLGNLDVVASFDKSVVLRG